MAGCSGSPPKTSLASISLCDVRIREVILLSFDSLIGLVDIVNHDNGEISIITKISKRCSRAWLQARLFDSLL